MSDLKFPVQATYIGSMKRYALPLMLVCAAPVMAQDSEDAPGLMERGAQMFLEGLLKEVEPRLDDLQGFADQVGPAMRGFFEEMGPALGDLMSKVEDWSVYEPPEILPNGDIIIRRKPQTPEADPEIGQEAPTDPIDL